MQPLVTKSNMENKMNILVNNTDGKIILRSIDLEKVKQKAKDLCSSVAASYSIFTEVTTIYSRLEVKEEIPSDNKK